MHLHRVAQLHSVLHSGALGVRLLSLCLSESPGFLPQSKNICTRSTGFSTSSIGVNVRVCVSTCKPCDRLVNLFQVYPALTLCQLDWLQPLSLPCMDKWYRQWMDGWIQKHVHRL